MLFSFDPRHRGAICAEIVLPFVPILPLGVKGDLLGLAGGLVVDHNELPRGIALDEWVSCLFGSMDVEFFFEKCVDGGIQIEWIPRRLSDTQTAVEIKTARTPNE